MRSKEQKTGGLQSPSWLPTSPGLRCDSAGDSPGDEGPVCGEPWDEADSTAIEAIGALQRDWMCGFRRSWERER